MSGWARSSGTGTVTRRLKTAAGVIWAPITDSHWVAVSPTRSSLESCLLITGEDAELLRSFAGPKGARLDGLGPRDRERAARWLTPEFRLLEEIEEPSEVKDHEELALSVFREYSSARELTGGHDLAKYHMKGIKDALRQFEEVEMTVSHLFREPHPMLGGMSYGGRFARALLEDRALFAHAKVLEVGSGTGIFGRELLSEVQKAAPEVYRTLGYTFFDLSPVLAESQREINEVHRNIVSFDAGDVLNHPFPEEGYDLVIANEMIADLPVVKINRDREPDDPDARAGLELALKLGLILDDAPPEFIINTGVLKFLERLPHILKPSGRCYVVEYGSSWAYPAAQVVTDHVEYSIHFGHLESAARTLGLNPELFELVEFLGFRADVEVLSDLCHSALFGHLLPFLGVGGISSRVYTKEMLDETLARVAPKPENLEFVPAGKLGGIAFPSGFLALKLARGATSNRRGA